MAIWNLSIGWKRYILDISTLAKKTQPSCEIAGHVQAYDAETYGKMPKNFPWRAGPIDPFAVFPLNPCGYDWGPFYIWRVTIFCCFVGWNIGIWHRFLFLSPLKKISRFICSAPHYIFSFHFPNRKRTRYGGWEAFFFLFSLKERVKERIDIFISYHSKEMKKKIKITKEKEMGVRKKIIDKMREETKYV